MPATIGPLLVFPV